jgi:polysaccharide export outer membrane protein
MHSSSTKTSRAAGCAFRGVALSTVLGISACSSLPFVSSPPGGEPTALPGAETWSQPLPEEGYGLQPGDIVRVSVWREETLDQGVLVRPDGGISFPLAGEVDAEGKTITELTDEIAARLTEFIPNPVVTVSLQENDGNRIYVTGRVNQPGVFLVNRPVDVMQALSMAGGLTPFADKDAIKILRRQGAAQIAIPFNYKQAQKGQALQQNILLQPGDTLVVP